MWVGNELGRRYQMGLLDVMGRHGSAPALEILAQLAESVFLHRGSLSQGQGHALPGQVILGGAQAAGGDENVGTLQAAGKCLAEISQVVPNDGHPLKLYAERGEPAGDPRGVGIRKLAHQKLGANGENFRVQSCSLIEL